VGKSSQMRVLHCFALRESFRAVLLRDARVAPATASALAQRAQISPCYDCLAKVHLPQVRVPGAGRGRCYGSNCIAPCGGKGQPDADRDIATCC
jgi:hypothetical protein